MKEKITQQIRKRTIHHTNGYHVKKLCTPPTDKIKTIEKISKVIPQKSFIPKQPYLSDI